MLQDDLRTMTYFLWSVRQTLMPLAVSQHAGRNYWRNFIRAKVSKVMYMKSDFLIFIIIHISLVCTHSYFYEYLREILFWKLNRKCFCCWSFSHSLTEYHKQELYKCPVSSSINVIKLGRREVKRINMQ